MLIRKKVYFLCLGQGEIASKCGKAIKHGAIIILYPVLVAMEKSVAAL